MHDNLSMSLSAARAFISHNFPLFGLIAVLIVHAIYVYAPCDDAYIYLVYARSFLEGKGLTYNGEAVQGYSSILWPWLIVVLGILKVELPHAIEILSLFSAIFVLAAVYFIGVRLGLTRTQAAIPGAVLALTGDFAFYAGNGLETLLFAGMVLIVAAYFFHPEPKQVLSGKGLIIVLFLLVLVRPEGALVSIIAIAWLAYAARNPAGGMALALKLLLMLLPVYLALRVTYGDWLPATYYAKSDAGLANLNQGLAYSSNFVKYYAPVFLLLLLGLALGWARIGSAVIPIVILLLAWIAQVTVQGGDNMVGYRMYLPILPVIYLTIVYAFRDVQPRLLWVVAVSVAVYLFWTYDFGSAMSGTRKVDLWRNKFPEHRTTGLWLKDTFAPGTKVALSAAGIIPYFSGLPTIDMLGLNNRHIALFGHRDRTLLYAHQAGDGGYVLDNRPGVIIFNSGAKGGLLPGAYVSDREIWQDPRFNRDYAPCRVDRTIWVWARKDLILEEQQAGKKLACYKV